jgi:hypothetical protein
MTNFAVLNGNQVGNVIVAETKQDAELATNSICIEYTAENPAGIGWTWDGTNFVAPVAELIEEAPTE